MLTAIYLDDDAPLERNKIDNVSADGRLSAKMRACALQLAKLHPQFDFLRRESFAEFSGIFVRHCQPPPDRPAAGHPSSTVARGFPPPQPSPQGGGSAPPLPITHASASSRRNTS